MAKVTLVPCSVKLTGKRDKVGHGEVTINNARIIDVCDFGMEKKMGCIINGAETKATISCAGTAQLVCVCSHTGKYLVFS